jgi:hypothetical protein
MAHNPDNDGAMRCGQRIDPRPHLSNRFDRDCLAFGVRLLRGQITAVANDKV